ncbi:MAG: type II secretion system protein GspJ [Desulfatirhabdiaceae bacterium]
MYAHTNCGSHFSNSPSDGFTLMEILISIAMMGVILLSVYGSYRSISSANINSRNMIRYHEQMISSLSRISADIQSMVIRQTPLSQSENSSIEKRDPFQLVFEAKPDINRDSFILHFMSSAAIPLMPQQARGMVGIDYYLDANAKTGQTLRRLQQPYPYSTVEPSQDDPVLCESVQTLKWTFYDSTGQAHDEWRPESKEGDGMMPAAIGIRLVLGDDTIRVVGTTLVRLPVHPIPVKTGALLKSDLQQPNGIHA